MIAILLSTYNGARFLPEQLQSFLDQTYTDWCLFWRDDGSTDDTISIMENFISKNKRCFRISEPPGRLGPTESFLAILSIACTILKPDDLVSFADQDDIWLPEKLHRGFEAISKENQNIPKLYFGRQIIVDENNKKIGFSKKWKTIAKFPQSITQNIAAGCTIILNYEAINIIVHSQAPKSSFHDWWSYILISAAGGQIIYDPSCVIRYRQHSNNTTGYPLSLRSRVCSVIRRGRIDFVRKLLINLELINNNYILNEESRKIAAQIIKHIQKKSIFDIYKLIKIGVKRQNMIETIILYVWIMIYDTKSCGE